MGKDKKKDKGKAQGGSGGQPKPTSSSTTSQPNSAKKSFASANDPKPNVESARSGGVHTDPKVAPQASSGSVPQPLVGNDPKQSTSKDNFVIPKKDKRPRSLSSKRSESSTKAPPSKKSYAEMAKSKDQDKDQDLDQDKDQDQDQDSQGAMVWSELQLRIYQTNLYHRKISFEEFLAVRRKVFKHAAVYLGQHPYQINNIKTTATYYDKTLNCGIFNCAHEQALSWFKNAITQVCGESYRGWSKSEQVTTFVKIFVPSGFEDTSAGDYLEATRILFENEDTKGIPWEVIKHYIHHEKKTHIIIASIPTLTYRQIKFQGVETSKGSGVWKTEGFLAPLKLTLAKPNDLKSSRNTPARPKPASTLTTSPKTPISSPRPQNSPKPSSPFKPPTPPPPPPSPPPLLPVPKLKVSLTSSLFKPDKDDPFLSSSAMSPSGEGMDQDQNLEDDEDVVEEIEVEAEMEDGEREVDLNLLNPDPDEEFGDWAEQD
jgi:hypothetical protein